MALPVKPSSLRRKGQKRVVVFDPEARKAHLRGFSDRKKQRRCFGLAMQRVKDRQAKIEQRAQEKKDNLERVEEAERQKAQLLEDALRNSGVLKDGEDDDEKEEEKEQVDKTEEASDLKLDERNSTEKKEPASAPSPSSPEVEDENNSNTKKSSEVVLDTKTYNDKETESHWGGHVTVTTSVVNMDDDSSDEEDFSRTPGNGKKSVDLQQRFAGDVEKYMNEIQSNLPGKKSKSTQGNKRKGKNGAADMKGMGGASHFKMAQKILTKSKMLKPQTKGGGGAFHAKQKKGKGKARR